MDDGDVLNDQFVFTSNDGTQGRVEIQINGVTDVTTYFGDLSGTISVGTRRINGDADNFNGEYGSDNFDRIRLSTPHAENELIYGSVRMGKDGEWRYFLNNRLNEVRDIRGTETVLEDKFRIVGPDDTFEFVHIDIIG